jgi:hypothetical protein
VLSKALTGDRLRRATLEERKGNHEDRCRYKAERLRGRAEVTLEGAKTSARCAGVVEAYAANTDQGLVRGYNEDRVAIILNILKPENRMA